MNSIYLFDSEKGGAGKSITCRAFLQYLIDRGVDFKLVETDLSNKDVLKFYTNVDHDTAELTLDDRKSREADKIFEYAMKKDVVVNFPANVAIAFNRWLSNTGVLGMQKTQGIRFVKFFLVTQNPSSIDSLKRSLAEWGSKIQHVVIANLHFAPEATYEEIFNGSEVSSVLQKHNAPVVFMADLDTTLRDLVDENGWRWDEARQEVNLLDQQRLKNWLEGGMGQTGFYERLDGINIVPEAAKAKPKGKSEIEERIEELEGKIADESDSSPDKQEAIKST